MFLQGSCASSMFSVHLNKRDHQQNVQCGTLNFRAPGSQPRPPPESSIPVEYALLIVYMFTVGKLDLLFVSAALVTLWDYLCLEKGRDCLRVLADNIVSTSLETEFP